MTIITPDQVVSHFANEDARVDDEVARIQALLIEREPLSQRPKHYKNGRFSFRLADRADGTFMEKVATKFRAAGWQANVAKEHDITGKHEMFVLTHQCLSGLPKATEKDSFLEM